MLPGVKWLKRTIHQIAFPVGVFFCHQFYVLHASPTAGLVNIPCQFHHRQVPELSALYERCRRLVVRTTATLRSDLNDLTGFLNSLQRGAVIFHGFRERLLDVSVTSRAY